MKRQALALLLGLTVAAGANTWTRLSEQDGYKSQSGTVVAKEQPQPAEKVVAVALSFLDIPYEWAGTSPATGFDCSGYVYEVMRLNGYDVPRMADHQFEASRRLSREELKAGDMVFFTTYLPGPSHVGIYLGDGKFVHASSAGEGVIISQLNSGYYQERFLGGGRPDGWEPTQDQQAVALVESPEQAAVKVAPTKREQEQEAPTFDVETRSGVIEPSSEEALAYDPFDPRRAESAFQEDQFVAEAPIESPREEVAVKLRLVSGELVSLALLQAENTLGLMGRSVQTLIPFDNPAPTN